MAVPYQGWTWPGVVPNPQQKGPQWGAIYPNPQNFGMGAQGYDISGTNPSSYYNSSGPSGAMGGSPGGWMGSGGMDPFYGYGGIFGQGGGQSSGNSLAALGAPPQAGMSGQPAMGGQGGPGGPGGGWNPGIDPAAPLGAPQAQGNAVYSPQGGPETILDKIFGGATGMGGGGPIGNMLYNLGLGRLPPALAEGIVSQNNEQFGKLGARFGTDLATANARGLAQASEAQSLNALQQILGLGGTTAGFQFQRGEDALQRATQQFIAQQQNQTSQLDTILPLLLSGGLGGTGG